MVALDAGSSPVCRPKILIIMDKVPRKGFMTVAAVLAVAAAGELFLLLATVSCYINNEWLMMIFGTSLSFGLFELAIKPLWRKINELIK